MKVPTSITKVMIDKLKEQDFNVVLFTEKDNDYELVGNEYVEIPTINRDMDFKVYEYPLEERIKVIDKALKK